jgi:glycine/D-amino acid oxidase-like deaminating enzyme
MTDPTSRKILSFWIDTTPRTSFPSLAGNTALDVAVIGGGITVLTAALLKRLGKTVAVIEAQRIAEGVAGNTTAKFISQHRLIYDWLIKLGSRQPIIRCRDDLHMLAFVSMPQARKDESHAVDVRMTVDFVAAFLPSQVEREADELEHRRTLGPGPRNGTNRRARSVPALRAFGEV